MPSKKSASRKTAAPERPDAATMQRRRTDAAHDVVREARDARAKEYLTAARAREAELEKRGYCF